MINLDYVRVIIRSHPLLCANMIYYSVCGLCFSVNPFFFQFISLSIDLCVFYVGTGGGGLVCVCIMMGYNILLLFIFI